MGMATGLRAGSLVEALIGGLLPAGTIWLGGWLFEKIRGKEGLGFGDVKMLAAVGALLDGAKIKHLVFDQNMSVLEGSLGILPRRVLVAEDDVAAARRLLTDAGLAHELRPQEPSADGR